MYLDGEAVSEEEGSGDEEDLTALTQDAAQDKTEGKRRRKTDSIPPKPKLIITLYVNTA